MLKLKVPNAGHEYNILVGEKLPMFTFVPKSLEVLHRLILKAAFVESIQELKLDKS